MNPVRVWLGAGFVACLLVLVPAVAWANGDDEHGGDEAKTLVLQAIALIVNTPDDHEAIEHRIDEAIEAPHTEGVDIAHVRHAAEAAEAGDLRRTRDFLQSAIGAGVFAGSGNVEPILEGAGEPGQPGYAVGTQTGTRVVLDEFRLDRGLDGGDLALIALSLATVLAGALLAWRYRPADTIRRLRRTTARQGGT